jgi:calcineurin-like phosphoesterase family protein
MIYFCSDLHYGHANICLGTSKWVDKNTNCRKFNTIEEMNETIVKSINLVVKEGDILYHLGDWSFGGWENIWGLRKKIICNHIIQINGNHDKLIEKDKFFPFLEKQNDIIYEIYDKKYYHQFDAIKKENDVTAKDLFEKVYNGRVVIYIEGQQIILDHYPYEEWENMQDGTWHLYGHCHHKLDDCEINRKYKRMDVGWIGKVYSFNEIKQIMKNKENKLHH